MRLSPDDPDSFARRGLLCCCRAMGAAQGLHLNLFLPTKEVLVRADLMGRWPGHYLAAGTEHRGLRQSGRRLLQHQWNFQRNQPAIDQRLPQRAPGVNLAPPAPEINDLIPSLPQTGHLAGFQYYTPYFGPANMQRRSFPYNPAGRLWRRNGGSGSTRRRGQCQAAEPPGGRLVRQGTLTGHAAPIQAHDAVTKLRLRRSVTALRCLNDESTPFGNAALPGAPSPLRPSCPALAVRHPRAAGPSNCCSSPVASGPKSSAPPPILRPLFAARPGGPQLDPGVQVADGWCCGSLRWSRCSFFRLRTTP